jgi:hypothetical protein
MKILFRLAVNALLYLVTIALVLGGIAVLARGEMASIPIDGIIVATGLAAMICVRCRLEGKPLGPPLYRCLGRIGGRRGGPGRVIGPAVCAATPCLFITTKHERTT